MIEKQVLIGVILNSATILFSIACLTSDFISFNTYKINLWGVVNNVVYEDVRGEVYTSYSSFESFACRKSRNEGILTVCGNILNFETSGIILQLGLLFTIFLNFLLIYNLIFQRFNSNYLPYLSTIILFVDSSLYLGLISKELLDPDDSKVVINYEIGCFLLFLTNIIQLVFLIQFLLVSRSSTSSYQPFSEQILSQENFIGKKKTTGKNFEEKKVENEPDDHKNLWKVLKETKNLFNRIIEDPEKMKNFGNLEIVENKINTLFEKIDVFAKEKWQNDYKKYEKYILDLNEEVEKTKRYSGMDDNSLKQAVLDIDSERKSLSKKNEKNSKEIQELKEELSRIKVVSEIRLEETERQKKVLENNKQILIEKQLKIEELEKSKKYLEGKEKNTTESNNELKKYLKEYEELLIQLKKDKDDIMRSLKNKESEVEFLENQTRALQTECNTLKSAFSSAPGSKPSLSEIEFSSLSTQIAALSESLKKSRLENEETLEKYSILQKDHDNLNSKFNTNLQEYQLSINKIYELENIIKQSDEVKLKYTKALDEINDLSTILESFRKDPTDSKFSEDKINYQPKYLKNKEQKQKLSEELKAANNKIIELLEESEKLRKICKEFEEKLNNSKITEAEAYKKLSLAEEEWERIRSELIHTSSQQTREMEILKNRMKSQEDFFEKELQTTQLALESAKDDLKKFQMQNEYLGSECEKLKVLEGQLSEGIPQDFDSLKAIISALTEKSSENIKAYEQKLEKILGEKEKLRKKLQETEADLQIASEENQQLHKQRYENRREDTLSFSSIESSSRSIQDSLIIEGISPSIIFHNPLLERISKLRKEPPMTYSTVWKTLELLMQEKLKSDKIDLDFGRVPMNTADYMFEFMYKQYGLKALGLKQLKALIVSLEELYKIAHPYATFFCRVLGIFHPRPLPVKISAYLFKAQDQFNLIAKKSKSKPENFPEVYETMQFGGEASIVDVIELIKKIFKNHRQAGERIIENLYRDQPDKLELSILKICAGLKKLGKNEESIFEMSSTSSGNLDYQEFIDGIREKFDIWITQEEAEQICGFLDSSDSGTLGLESWKKKISFEEFCSKINTKPAMVTKADFLNSFISEYEYEALEDYHELRKMIKTNTVSPDAASQYLVQIDESLSIDVQERIFKEALVHDGGHGKEVSSEALCIVILKHSIGGYGKGLFQIELLQQSLE